MKNLAAYLLLVAGGKQTPTANDIKNILGSVGVEYDAARVEALIKAFSNKTVAEAIAEGSSKLASVSTGGVAAAASSGAAATADAPAEEEKEEEKEESDDDMGFGLFD